MDRREFLKASSALGATSLSGCGAIRDLICPSPDCVDPFASIPQSMVDPLLEGYVDPTTVNRFLEPPNPITGVKTVTRAVDAHVHIYNASDWQTAGLITELLAESLPEDVRPLLKELSKAIEKVVRDASVHLSPREEMRKLNLWASLPTAAAARVEADADSIAHDQWLATTFYTATKGTLLEDVIETALIAAPTLFTGSTHSEYSEDFLKDAFVYSQTEPVTPIPAAVSGSLDLSSVSGLPGLIYHMLSPRYRNLRAYQAAFSTSADSFGVNQCYASLLDLDYWIGECPHPRSRMRDQVILMARIAQLSGDYMRPLVAYNPWTDIEDANASYDLVKKAVNEYNFAGVKIMPNLGYFPDRGSTWTYPSGGSQPANKALLEERLKDLFAFCQDEEIPVMSHASWSMGISPEHKNVGGPDSWVEFFKGDANKCARVNLAHIGGESEDDEPGTISSYEWIEDYASEMSNPDAAYMYGDLGMWTDLISEDEAAAAAALTAIKQALLKPGVADSFMYGTDWSSLARMFPWRNYPQKFENVLLNGVGTGAAHVTGIPPAIVEKIFYENVDRLFDPQVDICVPTLPQNLPSGGTTPEKPFQGNQVPSEGRRN